MTSVPRTWPPATSYFIQQVIYRRECLVASLGHQLGPDMSPPLLLQERTTVKFCSGLWTELRILAQRTMPYPSQPSACPILSQEWKLWPYFPSMIHTLPFLLSLRSTGRACVCSTHSVEPNSMYTHLKREKKENSSSILKARFVLRLECFCTLLEVSNNSAHINGSIASTIQFKMDQFLFKTPAQYSLFAIFLWTSLFLF